MTTTIQAIIFDRDGTLVEFCTTCVKALEAELRTLAPQLPIDASITHWMEWPGPWPRTVADEPRFWDDFWSTLAERYSMSTEVADTLRAFGDRYYDCFRTYADTLPCLALLRQQYPHIQLAVLTNFELPSVGASLRYAGIDPAWFAIIRSSSTIGSAKPDPHAFASVCTLLQVDPTACMLVDDTTAHIAGAQTLGIRSVLIDRTQAYPKWTGERIESLQQLGDLIA